MTGDRTRWAESFDLEKTNLHKIGGCDAAIYQTKDVIHSGRNGNEDLVGRMPVYHVWKGDRRVYCGQNLTDAYNAYRRLLSGAMSESYGIYRGGQQDERMD